MIVTKDPHMEFVAVDSKGHKQIVYNDETYEHNYPFTFEVPFTNDPVPSTFTTTIFNLTKQHKDFYKKGMHCWINFNWGKDPKKIAEGFISNTGKLSNDGTTDSKVLTFTEGTNYSNVAARKLKLKKNKKVNHYKTVKITEKGHYKNQRYSTSVVETYKRGPKKGQKHIVHHWAYRKVWVKPKTTNKRVKSRDNKTYFANRVYRKGTTYKQVIEGIAEQAGIKIAKIDLAKNEGIKKSFTAKGKPLTLIKNFVKLAKSEMFYERGKLVIVNPNSKKNTWFVIDDKDLIQVPSQNDDDKNGTTWQIVTPLVPEVTVNTGIIMNSKFLKGKFVVKNGQHSFDGESPQTQCTIAAVTKAKAGHKTNTKSKTKKKGKSKK